MLKFIKSLDVHDWALAAALAIAVAVLGYGGIKEAKADHAINYMDGTPVWLICLGDEGKEIMADTYRQMLTDARLDPPSLVAGMANGTCGKVEGAAFIEEIFVIGKDSEGEWFAFIRLPDFQGKKVYTLTWARITMHFNEDGKRVAPTRGAAS